MKILCWKIPVFIFYTCKFNHVSQGHPKRSLTVSFPLYTHNHAKISLTIFLGFGMIVHKLADNCFEVIGCFGVEDLDPEEGHDFRSHGQQDEPQDGALQQEDHLGELGAETVFE